MASQKRQKIDSRTYLQIRGLTYRRCVFGIQIRHRNLENIVDKMNYQIGTNTVGKMSYQIGTNICSIHKKETLHAY